MPGLPQRSPDRPRQAPVRRGFDTLATDPNVGGADESRFFSFAVDPSLLVTGANVLAAEVHQQSPDSSDLSFDLRLEGVTVAIPEPSTGAMLLLGLLAIVAKCACRLRARLVTHANEGDTWFAADIPASWTQATLTIASSSNSSVAAERFDFDSVAFRGTFVVPEPSTLMVAFGVLLMLIAARKMYRP